MSGSRCRAGGNSQQKDNVCQRKRLLHNENVVFRKYMSFFRMSGVFLRRREGRYLLDLDDAVAVHCNAEMTVFLLGAVP